MSEVHARRRARLRRSAAAAGNSAVLVCAPANVRYLTGWSRPDAALLLTSRRDVLVTGGEAGPAGAKVPEDLDRAEPVPPGADPAVAAAVIAEDLGADKIGRAHV